MLSIEENEIGYIIVIKNMWDTAVSYTHLDVYKRQRLVSPSNDMIVTY